MSMLHVESIDDRSPSGQDDMLRVLVVDDEGLARSRLIRMLAAYDDADVIGEAADGVEALEAIAILRPDLVFLDVCMPGFDGFRVASQSEYVPAVVFVSAYEQYAAPAFDADAVDYLLKPVERARLDRAWLRARARIRPWLVHERKERGEREGTGRSERSDSLIRVDALERLDFGPANAGSRGAHESSGAGAHDLVIDRLAVRTQDGIRFFDARKLSRLSVRDKYVSFMHEGEELLFEDSLSTLEHRLAGLGFCRVHRSELVNLHCVVRLRTHSPELELQDGQTVPVSRRLLPQVKRRLGLA